MRVWAVLLTALLGSTALAVPPDARLTLAPGRDQFLRTHFRIDSVLVEPAGLVHAEGLPANEVYVSAPKDAHGAGLLLVIGLDRLFAWDLCVATNPKDCPAQSDILQAKSACPDLAHKTDDGKPVWTATVQKPDCLEALQRVLVHAEPQSQLELTLDESVADDFFRGVTATISRDPACAGLTAGYYGATLKLTGAAPRGAIDHALLDAYRQTVGHISYDASAVTITDKPKPPPPQPPPVLLPYKGPPIAPQGEETP